MIGRDDYPTPIETTTVQDANRLRDFAERKGMAVLSMWAIQRDNGAVQVARLGRLFRHHAARMGFHDGPEEVRRRLIKDACSSPHRRR